ncbi:MAG TPA: beta-propeller fold lactonase family protein, partial [Pirellulales bacterium]
MICLHAAEGQRAATRTAGQTKEGYLLPNGWTLTPAGEQITLTDMPLNIVPLADGRHVLVASSGYNQHELCVIDLADKKVKGREKVRQSWFGLALNPEQNKVWWAGGGSDILHAYNLAAGELNRSGPEEPDESKRSREERRADRNFRSGVLVAKDKLYSLDINSGTLRETDLAGKAADRVTKVGTRPYDVALSRNGARLYVSDWAARAVLAVDPADLRVVARIATGEHPNQLALHPKDDRLFVACASSNCVTVIDTRRGVVTETIFTTLFPRAPEGSTPAALAISPDGDTLFVANADNNCVAVIDIERANSSQVKGMIPTGWYPTSVALTPDGKQLLVGVGKGNQTKANPIPTDK